MLQSNKFTKVNRRVSAIIFQYRISIVRTAETTWILKLYLFCVTVPLEELTGRIIPTNSSSCMIRVSPKETKTFLYDLSHLFLFEHLLHPASFLSLCYSYENLNLYHLWASNYHADWHMLIWWPLIVS